MKRSISKQRAPIKKVFSMIRLQIELLASKMFEAIDELVDMETQEGQDVYTALLKAMNDFHPDYIKEKEGVQ